MIADRETDTAIRQIEFELEEAEHGMLVTSVAFGGATALLITAARSLGIRCRRFSEGRDFPDAGGLMSYGTDLADSYRQNGVYVGRIPSRREAHRFTGHSID